ncbi:GNAT family N-acetyltransferase [Phormidium tenue FACHB-886]|nr:GNAT family N-acetyltransferase [Phormidium tenue FACHB-886]
MPASPHAIEIKSYVPGALGWITQLHGSYYSQHWGLTIAFELEIAEGLAHFLRHFQPSRDGLWIATADDQIVGAIAVNGSQAEGSRLRWFIVSPEHQGSGIGRKLLQTALDFCQAAQVQRIYLRTFAGLTAARRLYEEFGFVLVEEYQDDDWGVPLTHQKFQRN